jgi:hypothetical protein
MEEPAERLIRRALGHWPPPTLGPTLPDDVLRRVAARRPSAAADRPAARWVAVPWLVATGASVAVLAHLEWSSGTRAIVWGLALALVPLAYSAALWPDRVIAFLVLCGEALAPRREARPQTYR